MTTSTIIFLSIVLAWIVLSVYLLGLITNDILYEWIFGNKVNAVGLIWLVIVAWWLVLANVRFDKLYIVAIREVRESISHSQEVKRSLTTKSVLRRTRLKLKKLEGEGRTIHYPDESGAL